MLNENKLNPLCTVSKEKIAASIQFRHDLSESQKRCNYQNELDRLHGTKRLSALHPDAKTRKKELQHITRQSLQTQPHAIYKTKFWFIPKYIQLESYIKRKRRL